LDQELYCHQNTVIRLRCYLHLFLHIILELLVIQV
jgi:hypothetical protein